MAKTMGFSDGSTADKLRKTLSRLGMNVDDWASVVSAFTGKLDLLAGTSRHRSLLKSLFSSNDLNEFNSYVFEVLFAYDFESKHQRLEYEVNQATEGHSSIDFRQEFDEKRKIYYELRLVRQRDWITQSIRRQLETGDSFGVVLDGEDERDDTVRLQNLVLSKCQDERGRPIKFGPPKRWRYNFIVANVSELHLTMVDKPDCILAMYGDTGVPMLFRRGVFGLCEQLSQTSSEDQEKYHGKFCHFRETIHGVIFVRFAKGSVLEGMYIDGELEYFLVANPHLLDKSEFELISKGLSAFLRQWDQ
jgi:hypothetical protein